MSDRFYFRAWTGTQMLSDVAVCNGVYVSADWSKCEDFTVMQCTGLKDKNGKLIYEGDILQSEEYPFKNEKGYNYAAEVLWDDASATFYYYTFKISNNVAGRSTGNTGELNEYEDWKVIGNIYENKELLESEG